MSFENYWWGGHPAPPHPLILQNCVYYLVPSFQTLADNFIRLSILKVSPAPASPIKILIVHIQEQIQSSNVLHSSSLLLKVIWRCSTSLLHYMVSQNMVSQSSYGSIIWFLNHHMVPLYGFSIIVWFHYMVSQSSYGIPKYGFSIIVWFHFMVSQSSYGSIIWFLNHHMVSQNMVSQSSYGSIIWFLNHHMVPLYGFSIKKWFPKRWFSQKFGKLYVSKSDKCV